MRGYVDVSCAFPRKIVSRVKALTENKSKPDAGKRPHLWWIDLLRGWAVLGVLLFHCRVDLWQGWKLVLNHPDQFGVFTRGVAFLAGPFSLGGSGVMLFFLVSGFCVHLPQAGRGRTLNLAEYSVRRFFRIYPSYLAAVLLTLAVEYAIGVWSLKGDSGLRPAESRKALESLFMIQNYGSHPGQLEANPSLWSLPVEMELYLAYPLLFWMWRRFGRAVAFGVCGIVSGVAAMATVYGHANLINNFAAYWLIWSGGALLAEWKETEAVPKWRGRGGNWWLAGTLVAAGTAHLTGVPLIIEDYLWGGAFFLLIWRWLTAGSAPLRPPKLISTIFVRLGTVSYSLYLVHFPVFKLVGIFWVRQFGSKPANLLVTLVLSLSAFPIAWFLYKGLEEPSHRLARRLARATKSFFPGTARSNQPTPGAGVL